MRTAPAISVQLDSNEILIDVRSVYGATKCYPICARAVLLAEIAGTTTLTKAKLGLIEKLGFTIVSMADADWRRAT